MNWCNNRDIVERVDVASSTAGQEFVVKITHKNLLKNAAGATGAPQAVSIIVSGIQPDPAPKFEITDVSRTGASTSGIKWNSVVGATYALETSDDLITWVDLPNDFTLPRGWPVEVSPLMFAADSKQREARTSGASWRVCLFRHSSAVFVADESL